MADAGYRYVNVDDCWSLAARTADGTLQPDAFQDRHPVARASWGVDYLKYDNCPDPGPNPESVNVDLTGKRRLRLLVTNAGDGSSFDRASWGDARVDCAL